MTKTIEAVYENGVLRPLKPLTGIAEHARVKITLTEHKKAHPLDACFGILPDEDAEEMRRAIEEAFEKVEPDDRK